MLFLIAYPILYEFILSFQQKLKGTYVYVGLNNYITLLCDDLFWHSLRVTIIYTLGSISLAFSWGLILALIVNEKFRGRILFRTILLLPWASPLVVVALGFRWIFHERLGIANYVLKSFLHIDPVPWLSNETWAMITAIVVNSWKMAPFGMIMMLGALQSIPQVLYEAADIDGANAFSKFVHITLPSCRGAISTVLLMEIIWSFCSFTVLYLLTEGGPLNATLVLPIYIYKMGFTRFDFGLASAASVVLVLIMSFFTFFYIRYIKMRGE
jgi:ABC-type sugar transport system permease subunit